MLKIHEKNNDFNIWSIFLFQVDFGRPLTIVAVVTKGLNFHYLDEYVKKYRMRYSNTSVNWTMVFNGTNDVSRCINLLQTIKTFCKQTLSTAYFEYLVMNRSLLKGALALEVIVNILYVYV